MPFCSLWPGLHNNPIFRQARTRAQNSLVLQKDVFNLKILSRVIFTYHHPVLKQTTTVAGDFSPQIKHKWVGHFNQGEPYWLWLQMSKVAPLAIWRIDEMITYYLKKVQENMKSFLQGVGMDSPLFTCI